MTEYMEIPIRDNEYREQENATTTEAPNDPEMTSTTPPATTTSTGSASRDAATCSSAEQPSAISELQEVFGTILLASKKVDLVTLYANPATQRYDWVLQPAKKPAIMPKWTGAFTLLDFPRELRDRIYYYYLYRPEGVVYRRNTARSHLFDDHPEDKASLFLTCRQVYDEAYQVFCRYNIVELPARQDWYHQRLNFKTLDGTLRMFPEKPARSLQRISISFQQYMYIYHARGADDALPPGAAFVQMLRDAYTVKHTFPKLREYIVFFEHYHDFFAVPSKLFEIEGEGNEEKIQMSMNMMKGWMHGSSVVPPSWLVFHFSETWWYEHLRKKSDIWNAGYKRLVREYAGRNEELEESGKKWIEETWNLERKKRKAKWKDLHPNGA